MFSLPFFIFDLNAAKMPILYMTWSNTSALEGIVHVLFKKSSFINNMLKAHLVLNPAVPYLILPATELGCFSAPTLDAVENILAKAENI